MTASKAREWKPFIDYDYAKLLKKITGYDMSSSPSTTVTEEDDQKSQNIEKNGFEALGKYSREKKEIILIENTIVKVSKSAQLQESAVATVVLLHEWAHALTHLGKSEQMSGVSDTDLTETYNKLASGDNSNNICEPLAQLIAYHCICELEKDPASGGSGLKRTFHRLVQRCPDPRNVSMILRHLSSAFSVLSPRLLRPALVC